MFVELFTEGYKGQIKDIKVKDITPEQKDYDRVEKLKSTREEAMAKSITDPIKLVRRTKAYVIKNGTLDNPFVAKMQLMGFTDKQIDDLGVTVKGGFEVSKPTELLPTVPRKGPYKKKGKSLFGTLYTIMNASSVYRGKISKVIPDLPDDVILLGTNENGTKIAIIGDASGMKDTENGLDYYVVPENGYIGHQLDTGNGYRDAKQDITVTDYVLVRDGKAVTKYKDASYRWYVFK